MGRTWAPERLPVLLAFMDLEHLDGLFERLLVIRETVDRPPDPEAPLAHG